VLGLAKRIGKILDWRAEMAFEKLFRGSKFFFLGARLKLTDDGMG